MAKAATGSIWLAIVSGIVALIGLIVNVSVDRDNIFDMATSVLFLIALILAWVGAYAFHRSISRVETERSRVTTSAGTSANPSQMR